LQRFPFERVRNKRFGTVWKIIEEKEVWLNNLDEPEAGVHPSDPTPAIHLRFWKEAGSPAPGRGKTLSHRYARMDPSFHDHWEILYDP